MEHIRVVLSSDLPMVCVLEGWAAVWIWGYTLILSPCKSSSHTQTSVSRVWLSSSKLPGEIQVLVMQIACLELRLGRMNVGSCDSNYCTMVLYVYECGQGEVHTGRLISQPTFVLHIWTDGAGVTLHRKLCSLVPQHVYLQKRARINPYIPFTFWVILWALS